MSIAIVAWPCSIFGAEINLSKLRFCLGKYFFAGNHLMETMPKEQEYNQHDTVREENYGSNTGPFENTEFNLVHLPAVIDLFLYAGILTLCFSL
ncbi:MAG TPA: hypothetical protein EYH05_06750 [Anaerolineae bacterium]|nr:hypothetical protein [Anaerolineae bacterium]